SVLSAHEPSGKIHSRCPRHSGELRYLCYLRHVGEGRRSMSSASAEFVVIGGGIVGASAAYALTRRGAQVTLVDRCDAGQATTAGAGIISPGTSLRTLPAFFALARSASTYYDELLAQLAEDGETETGYDIVGMLHVATSTEEAAQLAALAELFRDRREAGFAHIGDVVRLTGDEARKRFPLLAQTVAGAV